MHAGSVHWRFVVVVAAAVTVVSGWLLVGWLVGWLVLLLLLLMSSSSLFVRCSMSDVRCLVSVLCCFVVCDRQSATQ